MKNRTLLPLAVLLACLVSAIARGADEQWFGLYLQGSKIGYASTRVFPGGWKGGVGQRSESENVVRSSLLGQSLELIVRSTTWTGDKGRPVRLEFTSESGGRTTRVVADYGEKEIQAEVATGGAPQRKRIPIPEGARLVDDATTAFLTGQRLPAGKVETFYVLDPVSLALLKTTAEVQPRQKVRVRGAEFTADVLVLRDPRAATRLYFSAKGDLIKVEGPLGIEMLPEPEGQAKKLDANPPDIAFSTTLRPDRPIQGAPSRARLSIRMTGMDLSALPSDAHQTLTKDGGGWRLDIHPFVPESSATVTIEEAARRQPEWLKGDLFIPVDDAKIVALAKEIVGAEKNAWRAALRVHRHVNGMMTTNAGIGVLRDATEILASKEGVCRDHAILMTALMRSAGIPARLVSGLVYADGQFFYHAWCEVWAGERWAGLDSTRPATRLTATHIKIGQGGIDQAFAFPVFDGAKLEVIDGDR